MSTTRVFLLRHRSEARFLLGATSDLAARLQHLGSAQFDLERSLVVAGADACTSFQLEGVLHSAFAHQLRTTPLEGSTAWYDDNGSFNRVEKLLEHLRDVLPHQRVVPEPLKAQRRERQARERWPEPKLKAIHDEQERRVLNIQTAAEHAGALLQSLLRCSSFTAVVRTHKGYVLVGQAPLAEEFFVNEALEGLCMTTGGIDEHDSWGDDDKVMYYAAQLPDKPCLPEEPADNWYGWCERLVWKQQAGIPGFDLEMTWQEAKRAGELLAKCPTDYTRA